MNELLVLATAGFIFFSATTKTECFALPNIKCSLQPTVVLTKNHTYPYFVSLTRCKGSAHGLYTRKEGNHRCVASTKEMIRVAVSNRVTRLREIINIANHTSCKSECALTTSDCKTPAILSNCECKCPYRYMKCGPNKRWSQNKCMCECSVLSQNCPLRREFDEKSCQCRCKQSRVEKCLNRGRHFNYESCKCSKRRHSTSRGNETFAASNTIWICALVAEFLVLCLIFELVLYYKNHGMIYKISQLRKPQKKAKCIKDFDNGINGPSARITDEEDRYVYF